MADNNGLQLINDIMRKVSLMEKVFSCVSYASTLEMVVRAALRERVAHGDMEFEAPLGKRCKGKKVVGVLLRHTFSVDRNTTFSEGKGNYEDYDAFEKDLINWIEIGSQKFIDLRKYITLTEEQKKIIQALADDKDEVRKCARADFLQILASEPAKAQKWIIDDIYNHNVIGFGRCVKALQGELPGENVDEKLPGIAYRNDLIHRLIYFWADIGTLSANPCLVAAADCTFEDPCCPFSLHGQTGCAHHRNQQEADFMNVYDRFLDTALAIIHPGERKQINTRKEQLEREIKETLDVHSDLQELINKLEQMKEMKAQLNDNQEQIGRLEEELQSYRAKINRIIGYFQAHNSISKEDLDELLRDSERKDEGSSQPDDADEVERPLKRTFDARRT